LEALLEAYVPEAFESATHLVGDQFNFKAEVSKDLANYARTKAASDGRQTVDSPDPEVKKEDTKQRGARIAADLLTSPLVFPVLLICFLWYAARQDTLAERQIVSGLMQALIQQQTATTALIRDVAVKATERTDIQNAAAKSPASGVRDQKR
jgi:hypothetical protein